MGVTFYCRTKSWHSEFNDRIQASGAASAPRLFGTRTISANRADRESPGGSRLPLASVIALLAREPCECASSFTAEQLLPLGVPRRAIRNDVLETDELLRQATEFYDHELRAVMEAEHRDEFLAVEPISRTHDLGQTMVEAARQV